MATINELILLVVLEKISHNCFSFNVDFVQSLTLDDDGKNIFQHFQIHLIF